MLPRVMVAAAAALLLPAAPAAAQAPPAPADLCSAQAGLRCPDLIMQRPADLDADRSSSGRRTILRMRNAIVNVGRGPAELFGTRRTEDTMTARQVIADAGGLRRRYVTGAVLEYTHVPTRGGDYWKLQNAARFELHRLADDGTRTLVALGPKLNYCLRDLDRVRIGTRVPRRRVFPACNRREGTRQITLGTSVGWADVYPSSYPFNWIDVTGRRGCFVVTHRADPLNVLRELREDNNTASRIVRLPYRPGPQRCAPGERGG